MAPPGVHEVAGEVIGWLGKTCSDTKLNEYNEQELVDGSRPDLYSSKMWLGCFLRNRFPSLLITGKKKCFVAHHLLLAVEWDMPWDIKAILMYGLFTSLFDFSAWNQDPLMSNVFFPFPFHPYFFFHAPSSSPLPVVLLSPFISRTGNGPSTPQGKLLKHNNMPFLTSFFWSLSFSL